MADDINLTLEESKTPTLMLEGLDSPAAPEFAAEKEAEAARNEIEVMQSQLSPEEQKAVDEFTDKIDIANSTMVMQYGA